MAVPIPSTTRICWPFEWWPEIDQTAWTLACTPGDPFDDERRGAELRATSVAKHRKGYGRWLSFLALRGWLDATQPPLGRVTRRQLRAYFRYLRKTGNADRTIIGRFEELAAALQMALLRVGHELVQRDGRFRIELTPGQVKTDKPDRFDLPDQLTPYVRHYLDVVRPALLGGRREDAVWISAGEKGGPLTDSGISTRIRRLSKKRFGQAFGPHPFRHAIGTTAPLRDPSHPRLAAGLLGISAEVLEQHYNRSSQCQAGARFAELMERKRTGDNE